MKKIIVCVLVVVAMVTLFTGCNMSAGLGNYTFKKVHIDTHHYSGCLSVKKWHDADAGIEVLTEEAGSIFISEGNYILLNGDKPCPLCEAGKGDAN